MRRRKESRARRAAAILLSATLIAGMLTDAVPMTALAQEAADASADTESQKSDGGDVTVPVGQETGTESGDESGTKPVEELVEVPEIKPGETPEIEPGDMPEIKPTNPEEGSGGLKPGEEPPATGGQDGVTEPAPDVGAGQETPEPGTEEKESVSGNGVESKPVAAPQRVMRAVQAELPFEGNGWKIDTDGKLTIESDTGMTEWIANRKTYRGQVTSVEIQSGVKSIGDNAFHSCSGLQEITIPSAVEQIGETAFEECALLESITFLSDDPPTLGSAVFGRNDTQPGGGDWRCGFVKSGQKGIHVPDGKADAYKNATDKGWGDWADYIAGGTAEDTNIASGEGWALDTDGRLTITSDTGMTGWIASRYTTHNGTPYNLLVTSAEITGVTGIGKDAFLGCENLTGSITLPEGVTSIGENAFNNCPKLTGITIPGNVTDIGKSAFAGCGGLTGITIPGSVTSIGESAFATCKGLTSITIPDTVTSIGEGIFSGCSNLTSVTLPNNMTGISSRMFRNCSRLASITIPQNVTAIGESAFSGCKGLREITVPGTVTQIDRFAFERCASLESITFLSDTPPTLGMDVFGYDYSSAPGGADERCGFVKGNRQGIHVPDGEAETYKNATEKGWGDWVAYIADNAIPAEKHEHDGVTFTPWTETDKLPPAEGNYYLTENVTLTEAWDVPSASLCLNGKTITQTTQNSWAVFINSENTLKLYDCVDTGKITAEGSNRSASSVHIDDGTFYMYGGNISGNVGSRPAVSVYQGTFHMSGGKIADNRNDSMASSDDLLGGGVNVCSGTFYMEGGEISGNYRYNGVGGGVFLRRGTVYMSGGEISGNTNGIFASGCEIHMSGGKVTDNTGTFFGGLFLTDNTTMTAGGNIVITGNTDGNGKAKNLFISSSTFNIDPNNPLGSANIGVTTSVAPTEGNPVNITGTNSVDYSPCFHSDNADYEIKNGENNVVQLAVKAAEHVHTLILVPAKDPTCTEPGNTAYYVCGGDDGCGEWFSDDAGTQEITDHVSVEIAMVDHSYDNATWGYKDAEGHAHKCHNCDAHDGIQPHTPGDPATTTTSQTCTECGYEMAPVIGHTHSFGTKWESDETDHWHQCDCGEKSEVAPHSEDDGTVTKQPTKTESGIKTYKCTVCEYEMRTETIPATGGGKPGGGNKPGGGGSGSGGSDSDDSDDAGDNAGGNPGDNGGSDGNNGSGNDSSGGNGSGAGTTTPKPGISGTGQPKVKQEKEGNIQKEVRVEGAAALDAAVTTPISELADIVLTKEEKQRAAAGTGIKIVLEVKDASAVVSVADKALVEKALSGSQAKGYTLGQYLDITLYKVIGDSRNIVTETNGKITVTIDVPDSLKNTDSTKTRTFAVIRVHNGKAELLPDLDSNADTITIKTDRFSTYAVVYKDTAGGGNSADTGAVRVSVKSDSKNPGGGKDNEPKTGDRTPLELGATLSMIAGLTYLLLYFADRRHGMTEETKKELVSRLIAWAKQGGKGRTCLALAAIFVLLVYYHSIGKKSCAEWREVYGE